MDLQNILEVTNYFTSREILGSIALLGGLAFNKYSLSHIATFFSNYGSIDFLEGGSERVIVVPRSDILALGRFPSDYGTLEYLSVANELVRRQAEREGSVEAVCRHYVMSTMETYRELLAINGREDLLSNVWMIAGWDEEIGGEGHMMMEYEENDIMRPFEAFNGNHRVSLERLEDLRTATEFERSCADRGRRQSIEFVHARSVPGGYEFFSTGEKGPFRGGAIQAICQIIKEKTTTS